MWMAAFQEDLQKLGWVEDRNIQIDIRWGAIDAQSRERIAKGCGPTFSLRRARGQVSEPQSMIVLGEPSIVLGEPSGLPIDQLLAFAAPCQLLSPPGMELLFDQKTRRPGLAADCDCGRSHRAIGVPPENLGSDRHRGPRSGPALRVGAG
jgi:hypothetical protein